MCAIFVLRDGDLVEMVEQPLHAEERPAAPPRRPPGAAQRRGGRGRAPRWLLVRREMGVADREEGGDRWSLDHLFVDQDAIPTFVEVKRSSDTGFAARSSARCSTTPPTHRRIGTRGACAAASSRASTTPSRQRRALSVHRGRPRARGVLGRGRRQPEGAAPAPGLRSGPHPARAAKHRRVPQRAAGADRGHRRRDQAVRRTRRRAGQHRPARDRRNGDGPPRQGHGQRYPSTPRDRGAVPRSMRAAYAPELAERVLALYEHAKAHGSRQKFGRGKSPGATAWMGEHEDPEVANPARGHVLGRR